MNETRKYTEVDAVAEMMRFITAKWISKPLYVAARLGIADLLAEGPLSGAELARRCGCHAPSLYRVLRALAAVGIFSERGGQSFAQTPLSACLRSGALRAAALSFTAPWNDKAWTFLLEGVRTGATPFELAHGQRFTDWLKANPRAAATLQEANAVKAATSQRAVLDVYDFSGLRLLVDVGGGTGALTAEILASRPALRGIVADLPSVLPAAERTIAARGLAGRCRAVACDFFSSVPPGGDIYLLSDILHDWPDARCREILATCRRAVSGRARLLIVEMLLPPGPGFSAAKLLDLEMLVLCGGRQRTAAEIGELLEASGFALKRVLPAPAGVSVLEALPA
jgi:hypothetical protein